jgi:hypothetical protein
MSCSGPVTIVINSVIRTGSDKIRVKYIFDSCDLSDDCRYFDVSFKLLDKIDDSNSDNTNGEDIYICTMRWSWELKMTLLYDTDGKRIKFLSELERERVPYDVIRGLLDTIYLKDKWSRVKLDTFSLFFPE